MLFIAPVHGKRKPHLEYSNVSKETKDTIKTLELQEKCDGTPSCAMELKKSRLENIVIRPTKPGSKVRVS